MKAYTLSILTRLADTGHPIVDKQIIEWANDKVSCFGILVNFFIDILLPFGEIIDYILAMRVYISDTFGIMSSFSSWSCLLTSLCICSSC